MRGSTWARHGVAMMLAAGAPWAAAQSTADAACRDASNGSCVQHVAAATVTDVARPSTTAATPRWVAGDATQTPRRDGLTHADADRVTATMPEPQTLALMVAAMIAIGFLGSRRRRD